MVIYFGPEHLCFLQEALDLLSGNCLNLEGANNRLFLQCYSKIENALRQEKLLSLQRKIKAQKE